MKVVRYLCGIILLSFYMVFPVWSVAAETPEITASAEVVIAQVQAGDPASAAQEYAAIYNNTSADIDVTGWCLYYKTSLTKPGCITSAAPSVRLILKAYSYTTFASVEFVAAHESSGFQPQVLPAFRGGMADASGSLMLIDALGVVRDVFTWSTDVTDDGVYQRRVGGDFILQDTDDDATDFTVVPLVLPSPLGLYEQLVYEPPDFCPNIPGSQLVAPENYMRDDDGNCWQDICPDIEGLQQDLPTGYELDDTGACVEIILETAPLKITELLPNAAGYDTGKEFVELYNPNNRPVSLAGYRLELGPAFIKQYALTGGVIGPGEYQMFSDSDFGFSLPNTTAMLRLIAPAGNIVSTTDSYLDPADDEAWAVIDDTWQLTNRPTPAAKNSPSDVGYSAAAVKQGTSPLQPCPPGKYRNPATNRCRNTESLASSVSPCGPGKYRNPETNRCRNLATLASSSLTPCRPDQTRNPATNRCRNASASGSTLKPCDEGQERSPETNRCRKVLSAASTAGIPEVVQDPRRLNTILIGVILFAVVGYAVYEYRYDIVNTYLRVRHKK